MAAGVAWVLNLDADIELGAGPGYAPSRRVLEAMQPHVARLRASLLGPDDVLVFDGLPSHAARGLRGRAFCPTPRAVGLLRRVGAEPEAHPSVEVLRRVNSRAFSASLGATLPGAAFVHTFEQAVSMLRCAPPVGTAWRVKHAFGMAGRGQRVVRGAALDGADEGFVRRGVERGGVQIEPDLAIHEEFALHGALAEDGSLRIGRLVRQHCDARGAWLATSPVAELDESPIPIAKSLDAEVRHVARALTIAGYFGPFGVDAYSYRGPGGTLSFQSRSEINARYSMGFATGFGIDPLQAR